MNRHLRITVATLRKDILVVWPLVAILFVMLFVRSDFLVASLPNFFREWMNGLIPLTCMLMVIGVIHQDASASVRHDWLTRPVPRADLVLAKLIFIGTAIYGPVVAFDFAHELASNHSLSEAVLHATSFRADSLAALVTVIMFAAVTATILEAAGAFVAVFAVAMTIQIATRLIGDQPYTVFVSGAGWVLLYPLILLPFALVGPLLWLQYGQRKTKTARWLLASAVTTILLVQLLSWNTIFAIQKGFTTDESTSGKVSLSLVPGCTPSIVLDSESISTPMDDQSIPERVQLSPTLWASEHRSEAGSSAIAFATSVTRIGKPNGWKLAIGNAQASYIDDQGQVIRRLQISSSPRSWPTGMNATVLARHFWLVPRASYDLALQQSARLQLEYSASLLAPTTSIELRVDGERRYFPGFGFCSAKGDRAVSTVQVDCFKRGELPALLMGELPEVSESSGVPSGYPDYTPTALEILSGASYRMTLRHAADVRPQRVRVTAYEARAHFNRQVVAPGFARRTCDRVSCTYNQVVRADTVSQKEFIVMHYIVVLAGLSAAVTGALAEPGGNQITGESATRPVDARRWLPE